MWEGVVEKLERLKSLDRRRQAFGAGAHGYEFDPPLPPEELEWLEREGGFKFPEPLRSFYTQVGDGGAGPFYGLRPAGLVSGYRPAEPYRGADAYRGGSHDSLTGLLAVIDEGCGHEVCVVSAGERAGEVVFVSADAEVGETGKDFRQFYADWLDGEAERFGAVEALMRAGATYEEIDREMVERFGTYDAGDLIVSIADVEKPPELFGGGGSRIYHGATQFPWYTKVVKDWQQRNR